MRRRSRPTPIRSARPPATSHAPLLELDLTLEEVLLDLDPGWHRFAQASAEV